MAALIVSWWLYVWITAPTFGSSVINPASHKCNHTVKYFLLFVKVRATVPWLRWMTVAYGAFYALILVLVALWVAGTCTQNTAPNEQSEDPLAELPPWGLISLSRYLLIMRLATFTLATVILELTIHVNNLQPGESVWSFGQILAFMIAMGSVFEVVKFVVGKEWKHRSRESIELEGMLVEYPFRHGYNLIVASLRETLCLKMVAGASRAQAVDSYSYVYARHDGGTRFICDTVRSEMTRALLRIRNILLSLWE